MKYCTHCGAELAEEAAICPKCGCPTDLYNPNAARQTSPANPPKQRVYSPLSIVGFVFAFLVPLVGLICSVIAFKNAQAESNDRCKSFTKAGIIISAIFLGINIATNIAYGVLNALDIPVDYYFSIWGLLF